MRTQFEDLPNELILEIFSYTKIQDLARAFWNLNIDLNQLICSCKYFNLILIRNQMIECELFSKQIVRLVIVTLENYDLTKFFNLRSLKLNLANEYHLKQIQSKIFPHLIYLSISNIFSSKLTQSLAQEVFSNKFPSLRYADLGHIDIPLPLSSWSKTDSLRSIIIISMNINIIPLILRSCPQLTHFKIRITGEEDLDDINIANIPNHPLKHFSFLQSRLSIFVWNINQILSLIPNLKSLNLCLCTHSFLDLIQYLSRFNSSLQHFDCYIIEHPNTNIHQIQNLHLGYSTIQHTLREDYFSLYTTDRK